MKNSHVNFDLNCTTASYSGYGTLIYSHQGYNYDEYINCTFTGATRNVKSYVSSTDALGFMGYA